MADDENPYIAALAALERERAEIDDMIAGMRKRAGLASEPTAKPVAHGTKVAPPEEAVDLRSDTFFGMVISDAIKKYLSIVKRPKKTAEIARGLEQGGLQHTSKNWYATVLTTLGRMQGVVVRLPNGWGLLDWYPGRNFEKKQSPRRKKRKAKKTAKNRGVTHESASNQELNASRQLQGRYLSLLSKIPKDKREAFKTMAKADGRAEAVKAMEAELRR